jgi:Peptidase MA superfamily
VTAIARRGLAPIVVALVVGLGLVAVRPSLAVAADPVDFGTPTAEANYGVAVDFHQPVDLAARPARVEILLRTRASVGPSVIEVDAPTRAGSTTLTFALSLADGHIVPNTKFTAQWRVTDEDGTQSVGPPVSVTYADTRVDWRTLEGDVVRVHWYEGSDDFGRRALKIGDDAVAQTSQLLGVTETEPIDFFIYADQDKFYDALGPSTRENVGGEAHADIRTMFALITPNEINDSWVGIVVPHELTHLVFDTATDNPYHDPPHWLNEGLAVYLSEGFTASDRQLVEDAAGTRTIIPLDGLIGAFPTTRDRFFLAYAESVSAVDWIVANKGRDALVKLIRSYAAGVSDDEAFKDAIGMDVATFERAWLDAYHAEVPTRLGPQPAPVGPLPEGWSGAAPNATARPGASPGSTSGAPASPVGQPSAAGGLNVPLLLALTVVIVAFLFVAAVYARSRRRPVDAPLQPTVIFAPGPEPWPAPEDSEPWAAQPGPESAPAEAPPAEPTPLEPESDLEPPPAPSPDPTASPERPEPRQP